MRVVVVRDLCLRELVAEVGEGIEDLRDGHPLAFPCERVRVHGLSVRELTACAIPYRPPRAAWPPQAVPMCRPRTSAAAAAHPSRRPRLDRSGSMRSPPRRRG